MEQNKLAQAKILGEIYRIQKRLPDDPCSVSDDVIYGLLNGIERIVEQELGELYSVTKEEEEVVVNILNEYFINPEKLETFEGYYDIEPRLEQNGIDRSKAIRILTLLQSEGRFTNIIEKMDSSHSPGECRTFKIAEWYK